MNAHVPLKHQQKKGTKDHLNKTVLCLVIDVDHPTSNNNYSIKPVC